MAESTRGIPISDIGLDDYRGEQEVLYSKLQKWQVTKKTKGKNGIIYIYVKEVF